MDSVDFGYNLEVVLRYVYVRSVCMVASVTIKSAVECTRCMSWFLYAVRRVRNSFVSRVFAATMSFVRYEYNSSGNFFPAVAAVSSGVRWFSMFVSCMWCDCRVLSARAAFCIASMGMLRLVCISLSAIGGV